ncbi:unnamed protein product [Polarella glacialis]|uniref:Glycosyltransferase 2-like domain-containing protein n=1 Tax=Polarella glacialis TaxID=89957 RepID=A0A813LZ82_POLGL|nr:unnamed protein product [Polarella glacialis]
MLPGAPAFFWSLILASCAADFSAFPEPPDVRPQGCEDQLADPEGKDFKDLTASIIIPFKNERWDHIKATVGSILHYTPNALLNEIMFVSDGTSAKATFFNEIRALSPLISFVAFPAPGEGLILAKMRAVGAASLKSKVLIFLEPHTIVNRDWIQPLLRRIRQQPRVLAMPALDVIPPENFSQYQAGNPGHWRFEWNLNLIYTNPAEMESWTADPMPSPATSGGIFAIRKDWWRKLSFYDPGMKGWGGDHVEATMKVWRCGGRIEVLPCSRIGHMFRDPVDRPYNVNVKQVIRNYARMAGTWFDEYIEDFYKVKPDAREISMGNITKQLALREHLKCKDMKWYLENVDKEMLWEKDHICIPGCRDTPGVACCENAGIRSTIDRIMPVAEYRPIAKEIHLEL